MPSGDILFSTNFPDSILNKEIGGRIYSVQETENVSKGFSGSSRN